MHTLTCDSVLCDGVCFRAKGSRTDGVSCRERFGGHDQFPYSWRGSILVHCTGSFEVVRSYICGLLMTFMNIMNVIIYILCVCVCVCVRACTCMVGEWVGR